MQRSKPVRTAALLASFLYILFAPVVGVLLSWLWLHWILASLITFFGVLFWPLFLYETVKRPAHEPLFTGRIDHPGGGIGVAIGLVSVALLIQRGHNLGATLCLILLVPVLGVAFSLLSELANFTLQRWRWNRLNHERRCHSTTDLD